MLLYMYICEINKNVAQFPFTKSKTEFDNNYKKLYGRTKSPVAERLKTQNLRIRDISGKSQTAREHILVPNLPFRAKCLAVRLRKYAKNRYQCFLVLYNFAGFLNFSQLNILSNYFGQDYLQKQTLAYNLPQSPSCFNLLLFFITSKFF